MPPVAGACSPSSCVDRTHGARADGRRHRLGLGKATIEISHHDEHLARWTSKNLAGVALPVNADIPSEIDVAFVEEVDEHASPIGRKGIGGLGATGVDAAVADAVFHATGRRIRELPITPDKLV